MICAVYKHDPKKVPLPALSLWVREFFYLLKLFGKKHLSADLLKFPNWSIKKRQRNKNIIIFSLRRRFNKSFLFIIS